MQGNKSLEKQCISKAVAHPKQMEAQTKKMRRLVDNNSYSHEDDQAVLSSRYKKLKLDLAQPLKKRKILKKATILKYFPSANATLELNFEVVHYVIVIFGEVAQRPNSKAVNPNSIVPDTAMLGGAKYNE